MCRDILIGLAMASVISAALYGPLAIPPSNADGGVIRPMPRSAPAIRSSRPIPNPARCDDLAGTDDDARCP